MKPKKKRILFIVIGGVSLLLCLAVLFCALAIASGKKYPQDRFGLPVYRSESDRDGDGVDDQSDIVASVKEYLATNPQYKSAYYAGGWPDDGCGVCTDVVARGLLGAGYDLQALVDADRKASPESYLAGEEPDSNIDFRRVRNLLVYLERNATSLTCDPFELSEWQAGDIVVWENHIGVISEHRDFFGIAFVYHHGSPEQTEYEQDILLTGGTIVGHFRIGT